MFHDAWNSGAWNSACQYIYVHTYMYLHGKRQKMRVATYICPPPTEKENRFQIARRRAKPLYNPNPLYIW